MSRIIRKGGKTTDQLCVKNKGTIVSWVAEKKEKALLRKSLIYQQPRTYWVEGLSKEAYLFTKNTVCDIILYPPSKELCSKMALVEVGVSLP